MILTDIAVRRPVTTAMFFLALGLLGVISWNRLPVQLFPELIYPEVYVAFVLPGASPEQMERDVVMPAEEEIGKLADIQEVESYAMANRGGVRVYYAPDADMKFSLLQIQSRMARLQPSFPERTRTTVRRFDTANLSAAVMQLEVLGEGDLSWLRDFSEEKIQPELEAVGGVVAAVVMGGRKSAVEVIVDPVLCQAHRITMSQIRSRLNSFNRRRTYVGRVYDGALALPVSIQGQFSRLEQIRGLVLKPEIPLRLGDVASVRYGLLEETDRNRVNGKPSVGIRIQKEDEANLIAVCGEVEAQVARLNREFAAEGIELVVTNSQADLMGEALDTLKRAALAGAFLALAVLFLFLRNLRFVAVLLLGIPMSLLVTFNLLYAWGLSINVLSLCGLALAVGMLTDNGIVVMENIFKHFERGKSAEDAARDGTAEVGRAVIAATATTVTVFLPVVFIQTDYRDILRELALAMTFPLLVSLLVALTLVPALASRTLAYTRRRPPETGRLMDAYTVVLKACLRHRVRIGVGVAVALVVTLVTSFFLMLQQQAGKEQTQFTVYASLPEGATLDATDGLVMQIEEMVKGIEGLDRFTSSVQETQGSVTVMLKNRADRPNGISTEEIKEKLDEVLKEIQGGVIGYDPPARAGRGGGRGGIAGGRRTGGFNLTGGDQSEMAVVRGYDFTTLQMVADDLAFRLQELEEIEYNTVRADAERGAPEVQVIPQEALMFDQDLQVSAVLSAVGDAQPTGFQTSVAFLKADGTEDAIEVRTIEDPRRDAPGLAEFRQTPILTQADHYISLDEVSRVRTDEGRSSILRTDQSRRSVVSYQYTSEVQDSQLRLDSSRNLVRTLVHDMVLPEGYTIEIIEAEADMVYYWMMGIAAVLIYMILASLFESLSAPVVILCTLPTAVIGSCWALMMSGTGLTSQEGPMALLGLIVLIGIAVNNGIILIDAVGTLRVRHGFPRERAVLDAGRSRVRPILMTSATTLLGVLPLSLTFGGDFEIWPPFAITVLGGLSVSMLSTLIFVPVAYMGLDQIKDWLRDIGLVGGVLATAAAGVSAYGIHTRYESVFWTSLSALPLWFAFLGAAWGVIRVHRARVAERLASRPVYTIQLRNLTKIYGAPGRFSREWARFERRATRLLATGRDPVNKKAVRDSLAWKLPLLGIMVYLHTYFEEALWLYLLSLLTWGLLGHLGRCAGLLWSGMDRIPPRIQMPLRVLGRYALPLAFVGYVHVRLHLLSVTIGSGVVWMTFRLTCFLAGRVRNGRVDLEEVVGRLAWLRRWLYRGATAVPIIGVRRPPFQALFGVNLEIGRGMFGLLGPNGAGKTTLMRIVCQVLEPTMGSVSVDGANIRRHRHVQGLIGYLPQHFGLYNHLSAYEFLEYRALLEGIKDRGERRARVTACLDQVNLLDRKDDAIGSFSGGMRQRVGIAQTLLHMPQIIVVDEPTAGLDPLERIRFRNLLARVSQERIVIFSTHIVEDISGSCNRLAVLSTGRVLYTGTPQSMRELASEKVWEAVMADDVFTQVEKDLRMVSHLRTTAGVRARFLSESPAPGLGASPVDPTLEDAYLYLLGQGRTIPC